MELRVNGKPVDWFEAASPKPRERYTSKYSPIVQLPVRFTHPSGFNRHERRTQERTLYNRETRQQFREFRRGKWVPKLGAAIRNMCHTVTSEQEEGQTRT